MDNQHRKIEGYRELSSREIALMNEIKTEGKRLGALIERLKEKGLHSTDPHVDQRWVAEGNTDLQKGLMCLVRAVAQPTSF